MTKRKTKQKPKAPTLSIMPHAQIGIAEVDNPLYSRAHAGEKWNPQKVAVFVNIAESSISRMASRGLLEQDQVMAATKFRSLWEALGGAGTGAFDYSREPVDGGGSREPISDRQIDAGRKLAECRNLLGVIGYDVMSRVAGQGYEIRDFATTQRQQKTYMDYFKDGLDVLSAHWGYKSRTRRAS